MGSYVVAILRPSTALDAAVPSLAAALDTTVYELRLTLAAGFPAVVLITSDAARAATIAGAVAAKGQRVTHCDRADVSPSGGMTELRDFRLDEAALVANTGAGDELPFADIGALVRATLRSTTVATNEVKERKFRPGMAIATGGLILSKTTTKEVVTKTHEHQQVLYVFSRSGAPPFLLRERNARYASLGADLRPTSMENFTTTIRKLRERARDAVYDERLVNARTIRGLTAGVETTDLLAHLIAIDSMAP